MINTKKREILNITTHFLIFLLSGVIVYLILVELKLTNYWLTIPILLYILSSFFIRLKNNNLPPQFPSITGMVSLFLLLLCKKNVCLTEWFITNFVVLSFLTLIFYFINDLLVLTSKKDETNKNSIQPKSLFNVLYMNTTKAHEIAMLIDNKMMKTLENEQISKGVIRRKSSLSIGDPERWGVESGISREDSLKKRVYENFDIKTTKSIILRKIYDYAQYNKPSERKNGDLIIFEEVQLRQRNVDDTIVALRVLQDSNFKDDSGGIEINVSKMMETLLEDFTVDYTFDLDNDNYIIQIPYKSTTNFESDYQHNDLQLGELSIIGIYRGEVDFGEKERLSSRFIELILSEYHNKPSRESNSGMKASRLSDSNDEIPFKFNFTPLTGKLHLIDVIAIIQELNIIKEEV